MTIYHLLTTTSLQLSTKTRSCMHIQTDTVDTHQHQQWQHYCEIVP